MAVSIATAGIPGIMKNVLQTVSLFMLLVAATTSCTKKEPHPSNVIISNDGLIIVLEWRTGASSIQAIVDADLDLFLKRGSNVVRRSENETTFEIIHLEDIFADGEYKISVESIDVLKRTEFTVYITDQSGDQVLSFTSDFEAGENNVSVEFVRINKSGTSYTITEI